MVRHTGGTASSWSPPAGECPVSWAINVNNGNRNGSCLAPRVFWRPIRSGGKAPELGLIPHELIPVLENPTTPGQADAPVTGRNLTRISLPNNEFGHKSGFGCGPEATGSVREQSSFIHLSARHKPNSRGLRRRPAIRFAGSQCFPPQMVDIEKQQRFRV